MSLVRLDSLTPGDIKAVLMRVWSLTVLGTKVVLGFLAQECGYKKGERRFGFTTS